MVQAPPIFTRSLLPHAQTHESLFTEICARNCQLGARTNAVRRERQRRNGEVLGGERVWGKEERKRIRFERNLFSSGYGESGWRRIAWISIRSVCYRKEVLRGDVHRLDLLDRGLLVPDGLVGECRRRHGSHSTGSDGPDVPRRRHQHPRSDHQRDSGAERIRRHGRVELGWQQHLRRDRWVSVIRRRYSPRIPFLLCAPPFFHIPAGNETRTADGNGRCNEYEWNSLETTLLGFFHLRDVPLELFIAIARPYGDL